MLELNGTVCTVNTSLTVGATGAVNTNVGDSSCGIDLADLADLIVSADGAIGIAFVQPPASISGVHWGLRWEGDHVADLQALVDDGRLTVDATALGDDPEIFTDDAFTYVGYGGGLDGDVNDDCKVNILDLIAIRNHLNQDPTTPPENAVYDVNDDDAINILDMIYVRNRLNTSCPEL